MKIALVTDGVYPFVVGGMQRHSAYLARYLTRQNVSVVLVHCITRGEWPEDAEIVEKLEIDRHENLEIITLRFPSFGKMPGHYLRESFAYSDLALKALQPHLPTLDLIYAKGLSGWMMAEQRRKGALHVPLVVKFHGYEMYQSTPGWRERFARILLRGPVKFINTHADHVMSYGGKITEIITKQLGVSSERVTEIPTGIAEDWLVDAHQTPQTIRRLIFVGRFERRKGVEELTHALRFFLDQYKFEFDFVGPVPYEKRLKHEAITYHGQTTDTAHLRELLDRADVLITPSHAEGMPNVIMEGMARGLAIVATNVGAVSAMVDHNNGWLIEPNDHVALQSAIGHALTLGADDLSKLQANSINRVRQNFTWNVVADRTCLALHQILKSSDAKR